MSTLTVGNRTFDASVVKLRADQVDKAREASGQDGLDNLFFKLGEDTYVASGRNLPLSGVKEWTPVKLDGQQGLVYSTNTGGITPANIGVASAVGAAGMIGSGALLGGIFQAMPAVWEFGLFGVVGAVLAGAVVGIAKLVSDHRAKTTDRLAKYGTKVS